MDAIPAALADAVPRRLTWLRQPLAEVRAGLSWSDLVLELRVVDCAPTRGAALWDGSCVELFTASATMTANPPAPLTPGLVQLFVAPPVGDQPTVLAIQTPTGPQPVTAISLQHRATADGYELRLIVPLDVLKLATGTTEFSLELAVTATLRPGQSPVRGTVFGSTDAYRSSALFGKLRLDG